MLRSIRTSQDWWSSFIAGSVLCVLAASGGGCQNRAPTLRLLDSRAGYGTDRDDEEVALYQRARNHPDSLVRSSPRIAKVYVYPHELPSRDYFWGAYVSLVVKSDEWVFEHPEEELETPPAIREVGKRSKRK
jgi:hypothetical protein